MSMVDVVGGVYGERCAFPHWDEVYGSAGRAAAGLSGHVDVVRLHTVLPPEEKDRATVRLGSFAVEVVAREGEQLIGFDYLHCLSDPVVTPHALDIRRQAPVAREGGGGGAFRDDGVCRLGGGRCLHI